MMYYFPEPPYLLFLIGFLVAITSGLAFEATLKKKVELLFKSNAEDPIKEVLGLDLGLPFFGICLGTCVFLATGLEIFSISSFFSYTVSFVLTVLIGGLIWSQLGKLLKQLHEGGSQAIDLDGY